MVRVAIVGPAHPYKGGIAQYTTALAHELTAAGHKVRLESWSHQYPRLLYPGQLTLGEPELPPFPDTVRRLSWRRPDTWLTCGRRLRAYDVVVLVVATPMQLPAYLAILAGLGGGRRTRVVAQCHNVLPHERHAMDMRLTRSVLARVDEVLVHSDEQAELAKSLTDRPVVVEHMAPVVVSDGTPAPASDQVFNRLLFFGIVRPYKGLDLLLHAMTTGRRTFRCGWPENSGAAPRRPSSSSASSGWRPEWSFALGTWTPTTYPGSSPTSTRLCCRTGR
ncbi:hypothetical protein Pflav_037260 [Phytohabitans flavus]|uniref:Glycosyltransferase subfamily 4-like N-terminal domain-containing protein n=1 Tax=Phytohabitans flavus TaxID=1076124 RepID=A0A6F8XU09_9ACTN|nr:hypothetical protein Pflav_037260 [Phytohabitans flavus]